MSKASGFARVVLNAFLSDRAYSIVNYNYMRIKAGKVPRLPHLNHPRTFNEKILYLKLYNRYGNAHIYADKYAVRAFVEECIGKDYLIPLFGVFDDPLLIDFAKLPSCFVAKPNHASGLVRFCDKEKGLDEEELRNTFARWLSLDYYRIGREYQYRDIPRKIVIEKMLIDKDTEEGLRDYKFFCFNGVPRCVQVDIDRFAMHRRNFYDLNWERLPFGVVYPQYDGSVEKPVCLSEMCGMAKVLSQKFIFSRVDFYEVDGRVYFGEITFHPEGGVGPFSPEEYDETLGAYLDLQV